MTGVSQILIGENTLSVKQVREQSGDLLFLKSKGQEHGNRHGLQSRNRYRHVLVGHGTV